MTRRTLSVACMATLAMAASALGSTLTPGGSTATGGTNAMASPHAYGAMVHSQIDEFNILHSSGAVLFHGKLESMVFENSVGDLTFDLAIIDSEAGLNGVVDRIGRTGFSGWLTDVDWRSDAFGIKDPARADRTLDGNKIEWNGPWSGTTGIYSGETSRMLFASTDAQDFLPNAAVARIVLMSGEFVDITVAAPVPAPGAIALLGLAGCLAGHRRRRA